MAKKKAKDEMIPPIRVHSELKKALTEEGEKLGLDLTAYIRHLLVTDPRRKKK